MAILNANPAIKVSSTTSIFCTDGLRRYQFVKAPGKPIRPIKVKTTAFGALISVVRQPPEWQSETKWTSNGLKHKGFVSINWATEMMRIVTSPSFSLLE